MSAGALEPAGLGEPSLGGRYHELLESIERILDKCDVSIDDDYIYSELDSLLLKLHLWKDDLRSISVWIEPEAQDAAMESSAIEANHKKTLDNVAATDPMVQEMFGSVFKDMKDLMEALDHQYELDLSSLVRHERAETIIAAFKACTSALTEHTVTLHALMEVDKKVRILSSSRAAQKTLQSAAPRKIAVPKARKILDTRNPQHEDLFSILFQPVPLHSTASRLRTSEPSRTLVYVDNLTRALDRASAKIALFTNEKRHVRENTHSLYFSLSVLQQVLREIGLQLRDPHLKGYGYTSFCVDVNDCLQTCSTAVETVPSTLEASQAISQGDSRGAFRSRRELPRERRRLPTGLSRKLTKLRMEFQLHSLLFHIVLCMINIYVWTSRPEFSLDDVNMRNMLEFNMQVLEEQIRLGRAQYKQDFSTAPVEGTVWAYYRIRTSAMRLLSKARVALKSKPSHTVPKVGDDLGESILEPKGEPAPMFPKVEEEHFVLIIDSSPSPSPTPHTDKASAALRMSPPGITLQGTDETLARSEYSEENQQSEDDNEHDLELMETYQRIGNEKFQNGDYGRAETFFQRALDRWLALPNSRVSNDPFDLILKLAQSYFELEKLDEARSLCESVISEKTSDDLRRKLMLDASFLLAKICYRQGDCTRAFKESQWCLKEHRLTGNQTDEYFDCISLVITIYEYEHNDIEAKAYSALLPSVYSRPRFKGPQLATIGKKISNLACYSCGQLGHFSLACPDIAEFCSICGQTGHTAGSCMRMRLPAPSKPGTALIKKGSALHPSGTFDWRHAPRHRSRGSQVEAALESQKEAEPRP